MKPEKQQRRAVGYVRVSVDNEHKVSPEIQAEAIATLCAAKGWELVHTEVERGRSAVITWRAGFSGPDAAPTRRPSKQSPAQRAAAAPR